MSTQYRERGINSENKIVEDLEKDWSIRTQKDIVNFRNKDRISKRNVDVEILFDETKLENIGNINRISEGSLKNFLTNLIKSTPGRLHEIHLCRDLYLVEDDYSLRKETIAGSIPQSTFDDITDLAVMLASHWSRNKNIQKIICDSKNRKLTIMSGNLDYDKLAKVPREVEKTEDELQDEVEDPKKKKKNVSSAKTDEQEYDSVLRPAVLLRYFRVR